MLSDAKNECYERKQRNYSNNSSTACLQKRRAVTTFDLCEVPGRPQLEPNDVAAL